MILRKHKWNSSKGFYDFISTIFAAVQQSVYKQLTESQKSQISLPVIWEFYKNKGRIQLTFDAITCADINETAP